MINLLIKRRCSKILTVIVLCCFGVSCAKSSVQEGFIISEMDHFMVGKAAIVKIYPENPESSIIKAYFDCKSKNLDKKNELIIGCDKELYIHKDTIIIQFSPKFPGEQKFHDLRILTKLNDMYTIADTTFYYDVSE